VILQVQTVAVDQTDELAELGRLRVPVQVLKVEDCIDIRVDEDVVATACPPQLEADRPGQSSRIAEADVLQIAVPDALEEKGVIHASTVGAGACGPRVVNGV
jgi:hypothetical protein